MCAQLFMRFAADVAGAGMRTEFRSRPEVAWQGTALRTLVSVSPRCTVVGVPREAAAAPAPMPVLRRRAHTGDWGIHDDDCRCMAAGSGYCNRNGGVWDCCGSVVRESSCAGAGRQHHTAVSSRSDAGRCECGFPCLQFQMHVAVAARALCRPEIHCSTSEWCRDIFGHLGLGAMTFWQT